VEDAHASSTTSVGQMTVARSTRLSLMFWWDAMFPRLPPMTPIHS